MLFKNVTTAFIKWLNSAPLHDTAMHLSSSGVHNLIVTKEDNLRNKVVIPTLLIL